MITSELNRALRIERGRATDNDEIQRKQEFFRTCGAFIFSGWLSLASGSTSALVYFVLVRLIRVYDSTWPTIFTGPDYVIKLWLI